MQPNMKQMPGMGDAKQGATASATGTVTAVNIADRKITFNHGPISEIKWPAMKMEFPVGPSVDLSKVKVGDKVRFRRGRPRLQHLRSAILESSSQRHWRAPSTPVQAPS